MPKAVLPADFFRGIALASISDERWRRLASHVPVTLSAEADARLRSAILECCSWFLTQQERLCEGQATAAVLRRSGKRPAPFERLVKGLRMAADAWKEINQIGAFHDDRRSDLRRLDDLEILAKDAERRLARLRSFGQPKTEEPYWREFVRKIARCCRQQGLNPTVTGRVYEHAKPTWFQEFMAALDKNLLGSKRLVGLNRKGQQFERDHTALPRLYAVT
jgi:hypothetical protein